jgi:uncharacterized membrane protein (UPF0127 family)
MLFLACTQQSSVPEPTETTATTQTAAPAASGPRVVFPNGFVVKVETVADDELRAQGLMYRDHLDPGTGMLFFFPQDGVYSFWMKNTRIPLDMIWIDAQKKVVHIKNDVPPCRIENCPSYDPGVTGRYVLEVAGGEAAKNGFRVGDVLRFEGMDHIVAR